MPARGDEDVGGLDVAMNDALGVRCVERVGDFDGQSEERLVVERASGDAMLEGRALEKLHGDEGLAFVPADFVDGADVGMVQRGGGARFSAKAFERLRILRKIVGQEFQRDEAAEFGVLGLVDDAHAAAAEFFEDVVTGDRLADHEVEQW